MTKRPRTYWIQICFEDGQPDIWVESDEGYNETCVRAGRLLHIVKADFALILKSKVKKGEFVSADDILAELNREARPGAKLMQVTL